MKEVQDIAKKGYKEITLLGQNVNSYGKTLDKKVTFAELLQRVEKIDGLERIRFMTPHPKDIEEETLEVIRDSKKICNHIHFPLQSGSSRLLKLMNRKYTKEHYLEQVEMIRRILPDVSITTDNRGYYHISGKVMIHGNIYLPRVLVNPNSKIVSTDCNCIYADEYTACGHIGALILKVQELSPNTCLLYTSPSPRD